MTSRISGDCSLDTSLIQNNGIFMIPLPSLFLWASPMGRRNRVKCVLGKSAKSALSPVSYLLRGGGSFLRIPLFVGTSTSSVPTCYAYWGGDKWKDAIKGHSKDGKSTLHYRLADRSAFCLDIPFANNAKVQSVCFTILMLLHYSWEAWNLKG